MITERFSGEYYQTRNYRDYLKRKFNLLAAELTADLDLSKTDHILDFGCGYGGLVAALFEGGFCNIHGTDVSQWAIEHGHETYPHLKHVLQYYNRDLLRQPAKLVIMLDVLEHMPQYEIESVLKLARAGCEKYFAVRIPVSAAEGEPFILPVSNNDPTHISCHTRQWWMECFKQAGFTKFSAYSQSTIYDSPGVIAGVLFTN